MKKILVVILIGALALGLTACGGDANNPDEYIETEKEQVADIKLSEDNMVEFLADIENSNLKSCDQYLYTFENQMATASYQGISHYIEQLHALNIDNLYIDILSSEYRLIETDNLSDIEKDLLQLVPMVMFFHEQYDMDASNITNVWCVGYDDTGNANNLLPKNVRILWVKDELNTNSTIGFVAYEDNAQTFYDYAYFNEDAMRHLNGIEKNSSSGKCVYTESKYLFLSQELHSILKATDGMDYTSISAEEIENILSRGTKLYEVLMYYRDDVYWEDIKLNRGNKGTGDSNTGNTSSNTGAGGYDMPEEGESFSDYVQRVDPDLYDEITGRYDSLTGN